MPVRKIPNSYRSVIGSFSSFKNNQNIMHESLLERDFFLTLEFDKTVKSYEEQPLRLQYEKNGRTYRYTPDVLVHYHEEYGKKPCIYEVKYSSELKEKKLLLKEKFEQIEQYLELNDMDFRLFTEIDMTPIYLENIRFIYGYININDELLLNKAFQIVKNKNTFQNTLDDYSQNKYDQAEITPYIWKLVLLGKIEIDLNKPISKDAIIRIVK